MPSDQPSSSTNVPVHWDVSDTSVPQGQSINYTNEGERHRRLPLLSICGDTLKSLLGFVRVLVPGTTNPSITLESTNNYHWYLIDLPSLYISVALDLFQAIENPDIQKSLIWNTDSVLAEQRDAYERIQVSWDAFRTSLQQRWRALNILTGILLTILMLMLGFSEVDRHTVTRTTVQLAICCTTLSLIFATTLSLYFGSMRGVIQARGVILEIRKPITQPFFNLWVFLSLPVLYAVWGIVFFIVSALSLIWQHYVSNPQHRVFPPDAVIPRILVTVVLTLGITSLVMMVKALMGYTTPSRLPSDHHDDISTLTLHKNA